MDICTISAPSGQFRGKMEENAVFFLGIPYAHADRFQRPEPAVFPDGLDCFCLWPEVNPKPPGHARCGRRPLFGRLSFFKYCLSPP